jgi:hypothetical protein
MSICPTCELAKSNGGKCKMYQMSDGNLTWNTAMFEGDEELEAEVGYLDGTFNHQVTDCLNFSKLKEQS